MRVLSDLGGLRLVMATIERLPQTGDKDIYLQQPRKVKVTEHEQCVDKDGEDVPEIRCVTWDAASRPRSTGSHGR